MTSLYKIPGKDFFLNSSLALTNVKVESKTSELSLSRIWDSVLLKSVTRVLAMGLFSSISPVVSTKKQSSFPEEVDEMLFLDSSLDKEKVE